MRSLSSLRAAAAALLVGGALLLSPTAHASPLFEHTGGLFDTGGLNARFTGSSSSSSYFNPGNITRAPNGINVGLFVLNESIGVRLGARDGFYADVPLFGGLRFPSGTPLGGTVPMPTADIYQGCQPPIGSCTLTPSPRQGQGSSGRTRAYASIGIVNSIVEDYLSVGLYAVLPLGNFTTTDAFFVDEREQFFSNSLHPEMYGDRLTAPSIAIGLGSNPIKQLSFGLAITIALIANADAGVYVPDPDNMQDDLLLKAAMGVVAKVAPHFSINYRPLDNLQLSAVVHSPGRFDIGLGFSNTLSNGNQQLANRVMSHDYTPWNFALGAEYIHDLGRYDLTLVGGVMVGLWSNYINRQGDTPDGRYGWSNTATPSIGARFGEGDNWQVGADVTFTPTPVPEQTGRTNYVDSSKVSTNLLADYRFNAGPLRMGVGANIQAHFHTKRRNTKIIPDTAGAIRDPSSANYGMNFDPQIVIDELPDGLLDRNGNHFAGADGLQTNNPGFPWYESSGMLFGGSVHLSIYY